MNNYTIYNIYMHEELFHTIARQCHFQEFKGIDKIQDLWSGYGQLSRFFFDDTSVIVKLIKIPDTKTHPKGWTSMTSHERKMKSYLVESNWYQQNHNQELFRIPNCLSWGKLSTGEQYLILEDLSNQQYFPKSSIEKREIKYCLKWLAMFHKHFLDYKPDHLWETGTYWHLHTRLEELDVLKDLELKKAATKIDDILKNANFQTIVHGDAKLANFLFKNHQVAAVDFQYVGKGVGVKDVAYFLSSVLSDKELFEYEKEYLKYYFDILSLPDVEKEWRELYPVAWCDFYRFLKGWSPNHYKINSYSEEMRNKVLRWI